MKHDERGVALGIVILSAIVFSVAAFAVLTMSLSRAQTAELTEDRLRARYAAEAALVWAMQRLWVDQTWSSGLGIDLPFDIDGDGSIAAGEGVDVSIPACGPPCPNRTLEAKVTLP